MSRACTILRLNAPNVRRDSSWTKLQGAASINAPWSITRTTRTEPAMYVPLGAVIAPVNTSATSARPECLFYSASAWPAARTDSTKTLTPAIANSAIQSARNVWDLQPQIVSVVQRTIFSSKVSVYISAPLGITHRIMEHATNVTNNAESV